MDKHVERLAKEISRLYPNEQDCLILVHKLQAALTPSIHINKKAQTAELIACRHIGLKWNYATMHKEDATDKQGRKVELKTIACKVNQKGFSIMYDRKDTLAETLVHYESPQFAGGHYWVVMNHDKTEVFYYVYVSQFRLLKFIQKQLRKLPHCKKINFGSSICKGCNRVHRVDKIAKVANSCPRIK